MTEFVRIHPQMMTPHQKAPDGWRLVLRRPEDENAELLEEQVLPECVMKPDAQVVLDERDRIMLTTCETEWLLNALGEMLGDCATSRIARVRTYAARLIDIADAEEDRCGKVGARVEITRRECAQAVLSILDGNEP